MVKYMQPLKLPHLLHGAKYLLLYIYYCRTYMGTAVDPLIGFGEERTEQEKPR
jgi:hypothetical protein